MGKSAGVRLEDNPRLHSEDLSGETLSTKARALDRTVSRDDSDYSLSFFPRSVASIY
ncbi:MAG: hypothetical protein QXN66_05775 [Thermoplasmatales archaeon]